MEPSTPIPPAAPQPPVAPQPPAPQPDVPHTPQSFQPTPVEQPPKKNRKPLIIGIVIAAAVLLLAGASALAYSIYQNPQRVVTDAIISVVSAERLTHKGTLAVSTTSEGVKTDMEIAFDGGISNDGAATNATITVNRDGTKASAKVETVVASDQTIYIKVNDTATVVRDYIALFGGEGASAEDISSVFKETLAAIDNKWIKLDLSKAEGAEEAAATQKCFQDAANKLKNDKSISKELSDNYKKNQFITIKKELGVRDINGTQSIGYELGTDEAKGKAFFSEFENSTLGKEIKKCDSDAKLTYDEFKSDSNSKSTFELWAAQLGHQLTRIEIRGEGTDTESTGKIVFEPKLNAPVTIQVPSESTSTETIIEAFQRDIQAVQAQF
jgi:hypothetical protein